MKKYFIKVKEENPISPRDNMFARKYKSTKDYFLDLKSYISSVIAESGGGGVTEHGLLTGLGDDDHSQYHNDSRADTWLATKDSDTISEGASNLYLDKC